MINRLKEYFDRIKRRVETVRTVREAVRDLLGQSCLAYTYIFVNQPSVKIEVPHNAITDYLKRRGDGPAFRIFEDAIAKEVDNRLDVKETKVYGGSTFNSVYSSRIYPGGDLSYALLSVEE